MNNQELLLPNGTKISWNRGDDGGGSTQYKDFIDPIKQQNKKYKQALEWCAGMSAIAFSLLDLGLAEKFALMDIYKPALDQAKINADNNNISDKITTHNLNKIALLPLDLKFDLVVANPPHCVNIETSELIKLNDQEQEILKRLILDQDWHIHKEFYKNIGQYLELEADLFLSTITDINQHHYQDSGLTLIDTYPAPELAKCSTPVASIIHYKYQPKSNYKTKKTNIEFSTERSNLTFYIR